MIDLCPYHPHRPADARHRGTCSAECEARLARARQRMPYERQRCSCGGELHPRVERGLVVIRCLRCRSTEQLSPLVVQHLSAV